jgi:hypothetical protein
MIAVRRRCRLAFVRGALETRQTRQNLASMESRRVANAFAIRFYVVANGSGAFNLVGLISQGPMGGGKPLVIPILATVGPHLLQRYGVSLGGPDAEERRKGDCENCKWEEFPR